MKYSENFITFQSRALKIIYNGDESINELEKTIDEIIAFMDVTGFKDEQFAKSIDFHKSQFSQDLTLIKNAKKGNGDKSKKEGFNECKKNLIRDLKNTSFAFKDI